MISKIIGIFYLPDPACPQAGGLESNMPKKKSTGQASPEPAPPKGANNRGNWQEQAIDLVEMTLEELERQSAPNIVLSSTLPNEFTGTVVDIQKATNRYGREVIKFRVELEDGTQTVISYPKSVWGELARRLRTWGFEKLSEVIGLELEFERTIAGRLRFPRHLPKAKGES